MSPIDCVCHSRVALNKRETHRRLVKFLLGLKESYETIRSQILMLDSVPNVDKTYSLIIQVED